jgi:hypothetical protein
VKVLGRDETYSLLNFRENNIGYNEWRALKSFDIVGALCCFSIKKRR